MNRQQKETVIASLKESLTTSKASFLVGYQGLTVEKMQKLRGLLREQGGSLKVAKARLMKRAVEGLEEQEQMVPHLKEQICMVFASNEAPAIAKVLYDFSESNEALKLVAGSMDGMLLDGSSIVRIASLPSREVLLAQVCGAVQAPASQFVNVLNVMILRLLWTLKQVGEKKQ